MASGEGNETARLHHAAARHYIYPATRGTRQQPTPVRRVGIVMPFIRGEAEQSERVLAFRKELARLGWTDGGNVRFDERWTTDNMEIVRAEAANLIASKPDVIFAIGGRVIPVLMQLSRSVPIVVPGAGDPVGVGWVGSLAHPGGNVTGFAMLELSILGKSLEILKQLAPGIVRVALIYNPDNPNSVFYRRAVEFCFGSACGRVCRSSDPRFCRYRARGRNSGGATERRHFLSCRRHHHVAA